jgi:SAM-dependent methyltransferase
MLWWWDRQFDKRHAVQTEGIIQIRDLNTLCGDPEFSESYEPMNVAPFPYLIAELPRDLSRFVFVDFGAGKGRTVLLAARHPFKKVIGVEFSGELLACM